MSLQARVRGWLARRRYKQVRAAAVFMQCCARRRAARRELLKLKTEARSVERFRELNKGMEVKLMQLQLKADYQVGGDRRDLGRGQREHDVWMCAGQGERRSEGDAAGGAGGLLRRAGSPEGDRTEAGGGTAREASALSCRQRGRGGGAQESRGEGRPGDPSTQEGTFTQPCNGSGFISLLLLLLFIVVFCLFKEVQVLQREKEDFCKEAEELSARLLESEKEKEGKSP